MNYVIGFIMLYCSVAVFIMSVQDRQHRLDKKLIDYKMEVGYTSK